MSLNLSHTAHPIHLGSTLPPCQADCGDTSPYRSRNMTTEEHKEATA